MRFRTRTETYTAGHTIDGVTHDVTKVREVREPVTPPDWDARGVKAATGLVLGLTAISLTWSTWAIGHVLGGGPVAYLAAGMFDSAWGVCLILEWLARFDASKRRTPRLLGWVLLVLTMVFIALYGRQAHSVDMAVVGASVSLFAKLLWLSVMRFIDRELGPDEAQWVRQEISQANARMAVAQVRRQVARLDDAVAAELHALSTNRPEPPTDRPTGGIPLPEHAPELPATAWSQDHRSDLDEDRMLAPSSNGSGPSEQASSALAEQVEQGEQSASEHESAGARMCPGCGEVELTGARSTCSDRCRFRVTRARQRQAAGRSRARSQAASQ